MQFAHTRLFLLWTFQSRVVCGLYRPLYGWSDNQAMALITLQSAQLAFGDVPLLDRTSLSIETSERIGLIGRNGTGKSSLLKILAGK